MSPQGFVSVVREVRRVLAMIGTKGKRYWLLLTIAQTTLTFLDLAGVVLIGLAMTILATQSMESAIPLQLEHLVAEISPLTMACSGALLLVLRSLLSILLTWKIFAFLGTRQAEISSRWANQLMKQDYLRISEVSPQKAAFSVTAGADAATIGVLAGLSSLIAEALSAAILVSFALAIEPLITAGLLTFLGSLLVIAFLALSPRSKLLGSETSKAQIATTEFVVDDLHTFRELSLNGNQSQRLQVFLEKRRQLGRSQAKVALLNQVPRYIFESALVVGVLGAALALAFTNPEDIEATLAILLLIGLRIAPSLNKILGNSLQIRTQLGVLQPALEVLGIDQPSREQGNRRL